jgi:hypothetical protein
MVNQTFVTKRSTVYRYSTVTIFRNLGSVTSEESRMLAAKRAGNWTESNFNATVKQVPTYTYLTVSLVPVPESRYRLIVHTTYSLGIRKSTVE